jgi:hypothetical protein
MQEILDDLKNVLEFVKDICFLQIHRFKLRLAVWLAEIKQRAFNKRFFVILMPLKIKNGKLVTGLRSITASDLKWYKRKKLIPKNYGYLELSKQAFYQTPLSLNNKFSQDDRRTAMEKYMNMIKLLRHK